MDVWAFPMNDSPEVTRIASAESVNKCVPTSFDWDIAKSKLITNNLGGKGPDKDVPKEMYFQGIATLPNEHRLDLKARRARLEKLGDRMAGPSPLHPLVSISISQTCLRHLVGVWIGGVWNGHFPESEKYFSEAEISRKILEFPQKERFLPNFRLRNLKIQSPKKCNSIPPAIPYPHETPS